MLYYSRYLLLVILIGKNVRRAIERDGETERERERKKQISFAFEFCVSFFTIITIDVVSLMCALLKIGQQSTFTLTQYVY